jgi:hypothetical protein
LERGLLDSFLAISNICPPDQPCTIVAYNNYIVPIHWVIQQDILIDKTWSKQKKEEESVRQIRAAFEQGKHVIMFIDPGQPYTPIRSLYKAVLRHFPGRYKELVHLSNVKSLPQVFSGKHFPLTYDVDKVIQWRVEIIQGWEQSRMSSI